MTIYWVNFRQSLPWPAGFLGDGANSVYNLGNQYPYTSTGQAAGPGGAWAQGWGGDNTGHADQKTDDAAFEHQAGRCSSLVADNTGTFQLVGLITGHTYKLYMSLGAIDSAINNAFAVYNDNRSFQVHSASSVLVPANQYLDASGTLRTSASDWVSNLAAGAVTLPAQTTNSLYFTKNGSNAYFNAIGLEDITASASTSTTMMMGV